MLAFVVDITARREAEKAIAGYMTDLERANERLARFAYVASHDIQEPLRKIAAFSDVLKTAVAQSNMDEIAYASGVMEASARHARALVSGLLNLARSLNSEYQISQVAIREVVEAVISNHSQGIAEESAKIQTDIEDFEVSADRLQLMELIENLVSNALKYHKPGQPPTIRVGSAQVDGATRKFWIEDDGVGFDPARTREIFEPFKRLHTREEFPGSGIGLAICRTVAQRHGWGLYGVVEARSRIAVRSRFRHPRSASERRGLRASTRLSPARNRRPSFARTTRGRRR